MDVEILNFGKIRQATVKVDGLTIIAGKNDSGKSTIGKALFSTIKSVADFPEFFKTIKFNETLTDVSQIIRTLIRRKGPNINSPILNKLGIFNPFVDQISYENLISAIEELIKDSQFIEIKSELENCLNNLIKEYSDNQKFELIAQNVFMHAFKGHFNNSTHVLDEAKISYKINDSEIANIGFKNNEIQNAYIKAEYKGVAYKDAILIDSPLYLEKGDVFVSDIFGKTLLSKIKTSISNFNQSKENTKLVEYIQYILKDGTFCVDDNAMTNLQFKVSKNAQNLDICNIASGTKSFGILQLLLKSGCLNPDVMLILDEPENHLHPEWQIAFAKLLVLMSKEHIPVLLTSHSTTLIHALIKYARDELSSELVNFYLAIAEKETNYSSIKFVNNDIDKIFDNLISPTDELY